MKDIKRDLDLVKVILKAIEKQKGLDSIDVDELEIEGWCRDEVNYNVELMGKGGLLKVERIDFMGGDLSIIIHGITWEGHDFLDASQNETIWEKADLQAKEQGARLKNLPYDVVKGLLVSAAKQLFNL